MKILDDSGLAYFWIKLKAAFARIVHVHVASDVTLMTGYSKPSSGSAIAASDSLNAAVGKLEAKVDAYDDSNYVHKTGNESIAGNKTFTYDLYAQGAIIEKPDLTETDAYKSWLQFRDSNNHAVFLIRTYPNGYGSYPSYSYLQAIHFNNETAVYGGKLILGYDNTNNCSFVACSDTSSARTSSSDIITRGFLSGADSNVVHRTGNEEISGTKTFNTGIKLSEYYINYTTDTITAGDSRDIIRAYDKDGHRRMIVRYYPNGVTSGSASGDTIHSSILSLTETGSSTIWGGNLSLGRDSNGIAYCACTETSASRTNSTDVITRGYLNTVDSNVVHKTNNESIAGVKSFTDNLYLYENSYSILGAGRGSDISANITKAYSWRCTTGASGRNIISGLYHTVYTNKQVILNVACGSWTDGTIVPDLSNTALRLVNSTTEDGRAAIITSTFYPYSSNVYSLGNARHLWTQLFAGTTTISTSDARLKTDIEDVPDSVLAAWEEVKFEQFRFKSSVAEKGGSARIHTGVVAQSIKAVFESHGIDPFAYGLLCYDEWEAEPELRNADGEVDRPASEASSVYSVRYEECLCMEAACQRRENARLKKRIADLEERLAALELKVS